MNPLLKLLLALLVMLPVATVQADPFTSSNERMMHDMHGVTLTGDADYDFIRGMLPHHQGAIDMARIFLETGTDTQLRSLAEAILSAQTDEIEQLNTWLHAYGHPQPAAEAAAIIAAWERINQRMMQAMHLPASGDINRDFAAGMIPHHVAAVDMSYVLLAHTRNPQLQQLARNIIREQEREIRLLQSWLMQADTNPSPASHQHH